MNIRIMKVKYNEEENDYTITFQYETDFNQMVIKTINNIQLDNLDAWTIKEEICQHIPTYHCK
tara:strand:+ start:805 stop:993 length:189 start_codon:yes stop_codon:yes gene_type:complete